MTEKEKMLAGKMYDACDPVLSEERFECKERCYDYNHLRPRQMESRQELMRRILGSVDGACLIEPPFWCDYGYNITVGENFYANHGLTILDCAEVTFGKNVFIGPGCGFFTAGHPLDAETRNKGLEYAKPIDVGDDVWFGGNVTVCPGVTIGEGCVVAAGSVVTRDMPAHSLVAGNPAKVKRSLNSSEGAAESGKRDISQDAFDNGKFGCGFRMPEGGLEQLGLDSSEDGFDDYVDVDDSAPYPDFGRFEQLGLDSCAD